MKNQELKILPSKFRTSVIKLLSMALLLTGCSNNADLPSKYAGDRTDIENSAVRIAYCGSIDEIPLFTSFQKGFFKKNGIHVDLVKIDQEDMENGINAGKMDAVTADCRFFEYIEKGLALKLTTGLYTGCMQIIVPEDSSITGIKNLKNAEIGIESSGDGTMVLTSMLLRNNGINPATELKWREYGREGYSKAFNSGKIDAACIWKFSQKDPQLKNGRYRIIYSDRKQYGIIAGDKENSCCSMETYFTRTFIGLSEKLLRKHPEKARFIARAWLDGAKWASENGESAVKLAIDAQYLNVSYESGIEQFSSYNWSDHTRYSGQDVKYYIRAQKENGLLKSTLNENQFYKRAFEGISP